MKKNYVILLVCILVVIIAGACKPKTAKTGETTKNDSLGNKETQVDKSMNHRFEIKSGSVELKSEVMKMEQTMILYWDDYGEKEVTEISSEMMGVKTDMLNFTKDGYHYNLNVTKKTGHKAKVEGLDYGKINFRNAPDSIIKAMNLVKLGNETFLGKECDKYSIDYKKAQMKGTYLVWKGIPLKSEVDMHGMTMKMIAQKIDENAAFPEDKYTVPADFKISEK